MISGVLVAYQGRAKALSKRGLAHPGPIMSEKGALLWSGQAWHATGQQLRGRPLGSSRVACRTNAVRPGLQCEPHCWAVLRGRAVPPGAHSRRGLLPWSAQSHQAARQSLTKQWGLLPEIAQISRGQWARSQPGFVDRYGNLYTKPLLACLLVCWNSTYTILQTYRFS